MQRGVVRDPFSPPPQPQPPQAVNVTQEQHFDVGEEMTVQTIATPKASNFSVLEAPPPPVKKMEKNKTFSKKPKLTNLTIRNCLQRKQQFVFEFYPLDHQEVTEDQI